MQLSMYTEEQHKETTEARPRENKKKRMVDSEGVSGRRGGAGGETSGPGSRGKGQGKGIVADVTENKHGLEDILTDFDLEGNYIVVDMNRHPTVVLLCT